MLCINISTIFNVIGTLLFLSSKLRTCIVGCWLHIFSVISFVPVIPMFQKSNQAVSFDEVEQEAQDISGLSLNLVNPNFEEWQVWAICSVLAFIYVMVIAY